MKFFIDGIEIQTVLKGVSIRGSIDSAVREAFLSYIFSESFPLSLNYCANIGSSLVIKNDEDKSIFKGNITKVEYTKEKNQIDIEAKDSILEFLDKKFKGRLKGKVLTLLNIIAGKFKFVETVKGIFKKEVNIISFGQLSLYDILKIIFKKVFSTEFKIYMNGEGEIDFLLPLIDSPKAELIIQRDVINARFSSTKDENKSIIQAIGRDEIVSGAVISVVDVERGIKGNFIVESDNHSYSDIHTMELQIKERRKSDV